MSAVLLHEPDVEEPDVELDLTESPAEWEPDPIDDEDRLSYLYDCYQQETANMEQTTQTIEQPETIKDYLRVSFIASIRELQAFFAPAIAFADQTIVRFTDVGMSFKLVDPAHIAMVESTFKSDRFAIYSREGNVDLTVGLDLDSLKQTLKIVGKPNDLVTVLIQQGKTESFMRLFAAGPIMTVKLVDTVGLADPKVPRLDLPFEGRLPLVDLLQGAKAAGHVSDHLRLTATREGVRIDAEGDTDTVEQTWGSESVVSIKPNEQKLSSLYSIDYFEKAVKALKGTETVTFNLGNDYPLKLMWENQMGSGTFLLAPRIE